MRGMERKPGVRGRFFFVKQCYHLLETGFGEDEREREKRGKGCGDI